MPFDKENHLYCYAIARTDLVMPVGKISAQLGHAYGDVLDLAATLTPERRQNYRNRAKGGSKVSMRAKNVRHLLQAYHEALAAGIPAVVIVDQGHIFPPSFNGDPVITAIGIGPCTQAEARPITKRFQCL